MTTGELLTQLRGLINFDMAEVAEALGLSEIVVADIECDQSTPYQLAEFNDAMAAAWGFDLTLYQMAFRYTLGKTPGSMRPACEGLQRTTRTIVERMIQEIKNT